MRAGTAPKPRASAARGGERAAPAHRGAPRRSPRRRRRRDRRARARRRRSATASPRWPSRSRISTSAPAARPRSSSSLRGRPRPLRVPSSARSGRCGSPTRCAAEGMLAEAADAYPPRARAIVPRTAPRAPRCAISTAASASASPWRACSRTSSPGVAGERRAAAAPRARRAPRRPARAPGGGARPAAPRARDRARTRRGERARARPRRGARRSRGAPRAARRDPRARARPRRSGRGACASARSSSPGPLGAARRGGGRASARRSPSSPRTPRPAAGCARPSRPRATCPASSPRSRPRPRRAPRRSAPRSTRKPPSSPRTRLSPSAALPWLARLRALRPGDRALLRRISETHRSVGSGADAAPRRDCAPSSRRGPRPRRALRAPDRVRAPPRSGGRAGRAPSRPSRTRAPRRPAAATWSPSSRASTPTAGRRRASAPRRCARCSCARLGRERLLALRRELAAVPAPVALGEPGGRRRASSGPRSPRTPPSRARAQRAAARVRRRAPRGGPRRPLGAPRRGRARRPRSRRRRSPASGGSRCAVMLARRYDGELARPDRALAHWRAVADDPRAPSPRCGARRRMRCSPACAPRAATSSSRGGSSARCSPSPAIRRSGSSWGGSSRSGSTSPSAPPPPTARCSRASPRSSPRCAGLRRVAERLGDAPEVARALERELELGSGRSARGDRGALAQARRGLLARARLDDPREPRLRGRPRSGSRRSSRRSAPSRRCSSRSRTGAARSTSTRARSSSSATREPERRRVVWLRVGELARDGAAATSSARCAATRRAAELAALDARAPARLRRALRADAAARALRRGVRALVRRAGRGRGPRITSGSPPPARRSGVRPRPARGWSAPSRAGPSSERAGTRLARLREVAGDGPALPRPSSAPPSARAAARPRSGWCAPRPSPANDPERARRAPRARRRRRRRPRPRAGRSRRRLRAARAPRRRRGRGDPRPRAARRRRAARARAASSARPSPAGARRAPSVTSTPRRGLLRAARDASPDTPRCWRELGEVLCETGDWPGAQDALEERLALPADGPLRAHLVDAARHRAGGRRRRRRRPRPLPRSARPRAGARRGPRGGRRRARAPRSPRRGGDDASQLRRPRRARPRSAPARLLRAAELELQRGTREAEAEALLREATSLAPSLGRGWRLLVGPRREPGAHAEALEIATRGLERIGADDPARAELCRDPRAVPSSARATGASAAAAYRSAAELDATRAGHGARRGAPAARRGRVARRRRGAGALREAHPGSDPGGLARALLQLGRLRAGPLEDVPGAVEAYRRALALDDGPRRGERGPRGPAGPRARRLETRRSLRHRALLEVDPTRAASLRALIRIAGGRGADGAVDLRLRHPARPRRGDVRGAARGAGARAGGRGPERARCPAPVAEAVRRAVQEAAREIGAALGVGAPSETPPEADDPAARFRAAVIAEEARLAAPALVPLATRRAGVRCSRSSRSSPSRRPSVSGDGKLVNDLARAARSPGAASACGAPSSPSVPTTSRRLDAAAWRAELRALAGAVVLERDQVELRTALAVWLRASDGENGAAARRGRSLERSAGRARSAGAAAARGLRLGPAPVSAGSRRSPREPTALPPPHGAPARRLRRRRRPALRVRHHPRRGRPVHRVRGAAARRHRLKVRFRLPGGEQLHEIEGRVCWVQAPPPTPPAHRAWASSSPTPWRSRPSARALERLAG